MSNRLKYSFIVAVIILGGYAQFGRHYIHQVVPEAREVFTGNGRLFAPPLSPQPLGVQAGPADPAVIDIPFSRPVVLSGFSFFSAGNLHSVSSYSPRSFEILYRDLEGDWIPVKRVHRHAESSYQLRLSENVETTGFRIILYIATESNTAVFGDLTFYQRVEVPWHLALSDSLHKVRNSLFAYGLYSILFYALLLVPGMGLLARFLQSQNSEWSDALMIVVSPLIMMAALILSSFLFVVTGWKALLWLWSILGIYGLWVFIRKKFWLNLKRGWPWVLLVLVALSVINLLQMQRDVLYNLHYLEPYLETLPAIPLHSGYYGYHADNTLQWGIALTFLHQVPIFSDAADAFRLGVNGRSVFVRTPFLPLASVPILHFFGEAHFIFQRWLNVLMVLYFPAMVLLVQRLISKRAAVITGLLLILSPHITTQTFLVEVYIKYVALYPLLVGLIFAFDNETRLRARHLMVGMMGVFAYMVHPIVLLFFAPLGLIYLIRYRLRKDFWRRVFPVFLPVVIAFVSWALFSSWFLSTHQPPDIPQASSLYLRKVTTVTSETLMNKLINVGIIFIPDIQARKAEYDSLLSMTYFRHQFVRYSLIMAVSPLMLFLFFRALLNRSFRSRHWEPLVLAIGPLGLFLALFHTYSFGAYALLYPFIVPLIWGVAAAYATRFSRRVQAVIIASFPVWMIPTLQSVSEITPTLEHESRIVDFSSYGAIALYIVVAIVLLRFVWLTTKGADDMQ